MLGSAAVALIGVPPGLSAQYQPTHRPLSSSQKMRLPYPLPQVLLVLMW
jgi:hypothetical protein